MRIEQGGIPGTLLQLLYRSNDHSAHRAADDELHLPRVPELDAKIDSLINVDHVRLPKAGALEIWARNVLALKLQRAKELLYHGSSDVVIPGLADVDIAKSPGGETRTRYGNRRTVAARDTTSSQQLAADVHDAADVVRQRWCFCATPADKAAAANKGDMVLCTSISCDNGWYHWECIREEDVNFNEVCADEMWLCSKCTALL